MKKVLAILFALLLVVSFVACSDDDDNTSTASDGSSTASDGSSTASDGSSTASDDSSAASSDSSAASSDSSTASSEASSDSSVASSDASSVASSDASSSAAPSGVALPFTTSVYGDFATNNWTQHVDVDDYYGDYAEIGEVGEWVETPELQTGVTSIAFDLISGSSSGPYAFITLYGKVNSGDGWTVIAADISTPGSSSMSSHTYTTADHAAMNTYKYFRFEHTGDGSANIGLKAVVFSN